MLLGDNHLKCFTVKETIASVVCMHRILNGHMGAGSSRSTGVRTGRVRCDGGGLTATAGLPIKAPAGVL
jgi:hypothetical protein